METLTKFRNRTRTPVETLTLPQRVVATLSRVGISPRDLKEIVSTIREINRLGVYKNAIPTEKQHIFDELARDGVIGSIQKNSQTLYVCS